MTQQSTSSGRRAGYLFIAAGLVTLANNHLLDTAHLVRRPLTTAAVTGMIVGVVALMAPWQRWHPRATLVLVVPALALIAAGNTLGGVSPYSYPVYFLLLFLWVGLDHPPWHGVWRSLLWPRGPTCCPRSCSPAGTRL